MLASDLATASKTSGGPGCSPRRSSRRCASRLEWHSDGLDALISAASAQRSQARTAIARQEAVPRRFRAMSHASQPLCGRILAGIGGASFQDSWRSAGRRKQRRRIAREQSHCTSTIVLGVWFGRWAAGWRDEAEGGRVMEWSVDCVWVGVRPFSVAQWGQVHGWSLAGSRPPTAQPRQARAMVETGSSSLFPIHWIPSFVSIPPRGEETKARTPLIIEPCWFLRARSD